LAICATQVELIFVEQGRVDPLLGESPRQQPPHDASADNAHLHGWWAQSRGIKTWGSIGFLLIILWTVILKLSGKQKGVSLEDRVVS
jgi:hypothetical protein